MNRTFVTVFFAVLCLALNSPLVSADEQQQDYLVKDGPRDVSNTMIHRRVLKKKKKTVDCVVCV